MSRITASALETIKQRFYLRGESVAEWAREHSFDERHVYSVLSGRSKATRGQAHLIAVELGLKPRLEPDTDASTEAAMRRSL